MAGLPELGSPIQFVIRHCSLSTCFNPDVRLESDVIHLKLFQSHVVVINSTKAASELLEKRSTIYSDR